MNTLRIFAVEGRSFPREDARDRFVVATEADPLEVPDTPYYRRGIRRGDIGEATTPKTKGKG